MKFIIDVPEGMIESCHTCPFVRNRDVCMYIKENELCDNYDFRKLHMEELNDTN